MAAEYTASISCLSWTRPSLNAFSVQTFSELQFGAEAQFHPQCLETSVGDTQGEAVLDPSHSAGSALIHNCGALWETMHSPGLGAG